MREWTHLIPAPGSRTVDRGRLLPVSESFRYRPRCGAGPGGGSSSPSRLTTITQARRAPHAHRIDPKIGAYYFGLDLRGGRGRRAIVGRLRGRQPEAPRARSGTRALPRPCHRAREAGGARSSSTEPSGRVRAPFRPAGSPGGGWAGCGARPRPAGGPPKRAGASTSAFRAVGAPSATRNRGRR